MRENPSTTCDKETFYYTNTTGSVTTLLGFVSFLNSKLLGLKFTMNYSRDEIQFLDLNFKRRGTILTSSL